MDSVIVIRNDLTFDVSADQGGYTVHPETTVEAAVARLGVDIAATARTTLAEARQVAEIRGLEIKARPQGKEITDLIAGSCETKRQAA